MKDLLQEKENKTIKVGMGVTEHFWSDRHAYEVTRVVNQKHVFIREYDVKNIGQGFGDNTWELISNPNNPEHEIVFRYGNWYRVLTYTKESVDKCIKEDGYILLDQKTLDEVNKKGIAHKYNKANLSFGTADYYYDYEF